MGLISRVSSRTYRYKMSSSEASDDSIKYPDPIPIFTEEKIDSAQFLTRTLTNESYNFIIPENLPKSNLITLKDTSNADWTHVDWSTCSDIIEVKHGQVNLLAYVISIRGKSIIKICKE